MIGWMRKVLFLCTGNYYRSRYAEVVFNHEAQRLGIDWRAASAGLRLSDRNPGPISADALAGLRRRGIDGGAALGRVPVDATDDCFRGAGLVVALKADEHHPLIQSRFPHLCDNVRYWDVTDVAPGDDYDPMRVIDELVEALLDELSA